MASRMNLCALPDDVLRSILIFTDWRDILTLEATSPRFRALTDENTLWKHFCYSSFTYWTPRESLPLGILPPPNNSSTHTEWRRLFREHHQAEVQTRRHIRDIIKNPRQNSQMFDEIIRLGADSKDALLEIYDTADKFPDPLARRYWSNVALGCLHRSFAIEEWSALESGKGDETRYLRYFGAFDLFLSGTGREQDLNEMSKKLDEYAARIRDANPDIASQTPRQLASTVAKFLLSENLVSISEGRNFHLLEHSFIGRALFNDGHNSLPIVSSIIYCSVAQRLGLQAFPCDLPLHVYAIVRPPPGQDLEGRSVAPSDVSTAAEDMHMDPFRSADEVSVSDILPQLIQLGVKWNKETEESWLEPSDMPSLTMRCARNILLSLMETQTNPLLDHGDIDTMGAQYAAFWAMVVLAGGVIERSSQLHQLLTYLQNFPYDSELVRRYIIPRTEETFVHAFLEQRNKKLAEMPVRKNRTLDGIDCSAFEKRPKKAARTQVQTNPQTRTRSVTMILGDPKYQIGQVFVHKRYRYKGVITGWDPNCGAGEAWIQRMQVESMSGGRKQPFYHVFVKEDDSMRYVGEENILVTKEVFPGEFPITVGKWFKCWDGETGKFVSNVKEEYPED